MRRCQTCGARGQPATCSYCGDQVAAPPPAVDMERRNDDDIDVSEITADGHRTYCRPTGSCYRVYPDGTVREGRYAVDEHEDRVLFRAQFPQALGSRVYRSCRRLPPTPRPSSGTKGHR